MSVRVDFQSFGLTRIGIEKDSLVISEVGVVKLLIWFSKKSM